MARTNYKCPECKQFNGVNGAYEHTNNRKHRCKYCGCEVTVKITGNKHWCPDWLCSARKR